MKNRKILSGWLRIKITSADLPALLSLIAQEKIELKNIELEDGISAAASVEFRDYTRLCSLLKKRGDPPQILERKGIFWILQSLIRRPVLLLGCLSILFLGFYLPSRVWFFQVKGNVNVPTELILEKAAQCGVEFGMSRRTIRSEVVKNSLLGQIPQLQWAGVTTRGAVATIEVREGQIPQDSLEISGQVGSIIAVRDGIVTDCTVVRGTPLCKAGQAVKTGEVLISGYTDCGGAIHAAMAQGEVYGKTVHDLEAVTLARSASRGKLLHRETKYAFLIGKKMIKWYNDSGNIDADCVKIKKYRYLTLPGGLRLPAALVQEERLYYEMTESDILPEQTRQWLLPTASQYLKSQMIAGKILSEHTDFPDEPGVICLRGRYFCEEMIGQLKSEEIVLSGTKAD